MAQARRERYTCPICGTVGLYPVGQMIRCKGCLTAARPVEVQVPEDVPAPAAEGSDGPPVALAGIALACGILAALSVWVIPVSLLLIAGALGCGIYALSNSRGDTGTLVMGGIGVALAVIVLVLSIFLISIYSIAAQGSTVEFSSGGNATTEQGGSFGSGGSSGDPNGQTGASQGSAGSGGSGGSGGSSGSGGNDGSGSGGSDGSRSGSGGSSAGGSAGSGGTASGGSGGGSSSSGGSASAPMPAALLTGVALLGIAAWRRRA